MKYISLTAALALCSLLTSCAGGTRPIGIIVTDVTEPLMATEAAGATRVGQATSASYFGLFATGDSSIAAAKANGRISTVTSVDVKRHHVLGIISKYTTIVRGH